MGAGRILAGAVIGGLVSIVLLPLFAIIPIIGGLLAIVIGGCAAGLVARGAGAGAAAGCLTTVIFIGALFVVGAAVLESLISSFAPFLAGLGIKIAGALSILLLILSIPTACCMTVSGAIGGSLNKPKEKPVTVEVKTQPLIVSKVEESIPPLSAGIVEEGERVTKIPVEKETAPHESLYQRMLKRLEEKFEKGEISEETYKELRKKYEEHEKKS